MARNFIFFSGVVLIALVFGFQNCNQDTQFSDAGSSVVVVSNTTIPSLECSLGQDSGQAFNSWPAACITQPNLASSVGFEMNNNYLLNDGSGTNSFSLAADYSSGTAVNVTLYVEVATYAQPDSIVITAQMGDGSTQELLDICHISTWDKADASGGSSRPPSDQIVVFAVTAPAGTISLNFDFNGTNSPTYLGVWNLGDFSQGLTSGSFDYGTRLNAATGGLRAIGTSGSGTAAEVQVRDSRGSYREVGLPSPLNTNTSLTCSN